MATRLFGLLGDPYVRSFLQGFLYWAGQSVVPIGIGIGGVLYGRERLKARQVERQLDNAQEARIAGSPTIIVSSAKQLTTVEFADKLESFHRRMYAHLKGKSLRRLKTEGDLSAVTDEFLSLRDGAPDFDTALTTLLDDYMARVRELLSSLWEATNKSKTSYAYYEAATRKLVALLEALLGAELNRDAIADLLDGTIKSWAVLPWRHFFFRRHPAAFDRTRPTIP